MTASTAPSSTRKFVLWNSDLVEFVRDVADERLSRAETAEDVSYWDCLREQCESMLAGDTHDEIIFPLIASYGLTDEASKFTGRDLSWLDRKYA